MPATICRACRFRVLPGTPHPVEECRDFQEITRERNDEWWS
jgi:hypothetical protein